MQFTISHLSLNAQDNDMASITSLKTFDDSTLKTLEEMDKISTWSGVSSISETEFVSQSDNEDDNFDDETIGATFLPDITQNKNANAKYKSLHRRKGWQILKKYSVMPYKYLSFDNMVRFLDVLSDNTIWNRRVEALCLMERTLRHSCEYNFEKVVKIFKSYIENMMSLGFDCNQPLKKSNNSFLKCPVENVFAQETFYPLDLAVMSYSSALIQALLESGAKKEHEGITPMPFLSFQVTQLDLEYPEKKKEYIFLHKNTKLEWFDHCLDVLQKNGYNLIPTKNELKNNFTPVLYAAKHKNFAVLRTLIKAKADINSYNTFDVLRLGIEDEDRRTRTILRLNESHLNSTAEKNKELIEKCKKNKNFIDSVLNHAIPTAYLYRDVLLKLCALEANNAVKTLLCLGADPNACSKKETFVGYIKSHPSSDLVNETNKTIYQFTQRMYFEIISNIPFSNLRPLLNIVIEYLYDSEAAVNVGKVALCQLSETSKSFDEEMEKLGAESTWKLT